MSEFSKDDIQPSLNTMLTDDPKSAILFAQSCVAFAKENRAEFIKVLNGLTLQVHFTDDAFTEDFAHVYAFLEFLWDISDKLIQAALIMEVKITNN